MIDSKEVVRLRDKRERVDSEKAARAAAREEKKKQRTAEQLAARTKSKGKGIAVINLDEGWKSFICLKVMVMKLWMRRWVIHRG